MICVYESIQRKDGGLCFFVGDTDGLLDQIEAHFGLSRLNNQSMDRNSQTMLDCSMNLGKYPVIRLDLRTLYCKNRNAFDRLLTEAVKRTIHDATDKYGTTWNGNYVTVKCVDMLVGIPHRHYDEDILKTLAIMMYTNLGSVDNPQTKKMPILLVDGYDHVLNHVENGKDAEYCMKMIGRLIDSVSQQSLVSSIVITGNHDPCSKYGACS